jgi:flagellar biogenesis protein FliO
MIWATVKMIFGLGAILMVLLLLVRFSRRPGTGMKETFSDSWVRLLSVKPIAPRKYISLVAVGEEVLVVGIAESQMTLLDKIADKNIAAKILATQPARPYGFSWLEEWLGKRNRPRPTPPQVDHGK